MAVFGWTDLGKLNRVTEEQRGLAASGKNARGLRPHGHLWPMGRGQGHAEVNTEILPTGYGALVPQA
jgi:hypothetical protein